MITDCFLLEKIEATPELFSILKEFEINEDFMSRLQQGRCWKVNSWRNRFSYVIQEDDGTCWQFEMDLPSRELVVANPHLDHRIEFVKRCTTEDIPGYKPGDPFNPEWIQYMKQQNITRVVAEQVERKTVEQEWVPVRQ
jgi:hypothetical protein